MKGRPQLLILGQSTIDHVVPAGPAPWFERVGGNALYAAAGARLWLDPARIAVVTRAAPDYPFDVDRMLTTAGLPLHCIAPAPGEHLVEWLIYETDGSRRSLPRNPGLRGLSETDPGYLDRLLAISPAASDVPPEWRWPAFVYAAPQLEARHRQLQAAIPEDTWLGVDPSPRYAAAANAFELWQILPRVDALLISEQEARSMLQDFHGDPQAVAEALHHAGFAEVVLKLGAQGAVVAASGTLRRLSPPPVAIADITGAGDAFGGAYAASRSSGHDPIEAARRGTAAAALVVATEGADAALQLSSGAARALLDEVTVEHV